MDRQALPTVPGVLHNGGMADVGHLLDHVQLAQAVDPLFLGWQLRQHFTVLVVQVANRTQPAIDQAQLAILHRSPYATATVMASDQDVLDLEHIHRVLDHRQAIEVGVQHHVGHVAVHKKIARQHADDLVGRYPRIGAADPEKLRSLLARELGEKLRVFFLDRSGPALVVINQIL